MRADIIAEKLCDEEAVLISGKANIYYYSKFTSEDAYLYITKNQRFIITDSRYTLQASEQAQGFEVCIISLEKFLENTKETKIYYEENYITAASLCKLSEMLKGRELVFGQSIISAPRQCKSEEEIKKIEKAEELGDRAFEHILPMIKPGVTEKSVALELEFFMRNNGASALSFETICASGKRGAMPHGVAADKKIEKGDFVTLDFGCVLGGYCSDMTRTVSVGKPNKQLEEIYNIVLEAQKAAIDSIKSGVDCKDADFIARNIIDKAGYGKYFGHSLGHSVGIEIHENPNLSPKSSDCLKVGNVVTVEPGIYIPELGGVRIEDVVAITECGCINLTKSPKDLIIV